MSLSRNLTRRLRAAGIVVGALVILFVGVLFGGHPSWLPGPVRSVFVSQTQNQRVMQSVLNLISKEYYRKVNTTKLANTGIEKAVESLNDPYSHYYPPSLLSSFEIEFSPQVAGIGVEVDTEPVGRGIEIEEVIHGSPAAKAGLSHGDVILAVDGTSLNGKTVDQGSKLIRGRAGTSVTLKVRENKNVRTVKIVRAQVPVPVVAGKILHYKGKKLGYIDFSQFATGSAAELRREVKTLMAKGARGLVLDLRDNPGGLVKQAVASASIFIPHGTIVTTRGRSIPTTVYTALGDAIAPKIPLVVVVDRGTASSAEILTAALKQRHRALVVGTHTYGKGVFQEIQPVPGGGDLDMTVGEYFTPDGENLGGGGVKRGKGVAPNIYVYDNPNAPGEKAVKVAEKTVAHEIK